MTPRILVVHVAGIGDAAVASTLLERLRHEQPDAEITWVCGRPAEPVVRLFDGVKRVIAIDQQTLYHGSPIARASLLLKLWRQLLAIGFDRALIIHPDPRYRVLTLPLIGVRKSYLARNRDRGMNIVPVRFLGDEYARLAGDTRRVGPVERRYFMQNLRARFARADAAPALPRIVLVPGGARNTLREDAVRRWPSAHYAEVARALVADGCEVVLVGAAHDDWVRSDFAGIDVTDRIGALDLTETLSLMANSDLVISHDTGPMHLARLVRAPLIALFGPTVPQQVLSIDETVTVLWGGEHLACRPCFDGRFFAACDNNVCLKSVEPRQVVEAARAALRASAGPSAAAQPVATR